METGALADQVLRNICPNYFETIDGIEWNVAIIDLCCAEFSVWFRFVDRVLFILKTAGV
jgi:hypothetical protein